MTKPQLIRLMIRLNKIQTILKDHQAELFTNEANYVKFIQVLLTLNILFTLSLY